MSEESQHEGSTKPAPLAEPGARDAHDATTNISQTQIGQMTASSAPAAEGGKWCCEVCTYENFPLSRKCTMCRAPKPSLNENIFSLQDGASALPAHDACGAEAITERLRPLRISSPQAQASASSVTKWACATCTYENWPKSQKCAMCGAAHPPPAAAPAPAPAPPHSPPAPLAPPPKQILDMNDISLAPPEAEGRRKRRNHTDWVWLQACLGVVEGSALRVEAYLASGGDPARALTPQEVLILNRASAFDAGHTLVHLAIRFQRQDILATLLSRISGGGSGLKRSPSYIAPDIAAAIRRHFAGCLRLKKGVFPCRYVTEFCTFALPAEISELPGVIQEQVFSELLDREAQQRLEAVGVVGRVALWNRSAGDCLLDAVLQAAIGVADRGGVLRDALGAALLSRVLRARWAAWERAQAAAQQYAPDDHQLRDEWARLVAAAQQPRHALRQVHVFALAHIMRRPLLVFGEDLVTSLSGEPLGYARFMGIYLPLLWEPDFCSPSPLCLGYTRGHFSALVPIEPNHYICREEQEENEDDVTLVPLTDCDGKLLPVHFLSCDEMGNEENVVRRYMAARRTRHGGLVARQPLRPPPLLQAQMMEEWLNHYRRLAQQTHGPFPPRLNVAAEYCSEPDTDDE